MMYRSGLPSLLACEPPCKLGMAVFEELQVHRSFLLGAVNVVELSTLSLKPRRQ